LTVVYSTECKAVQKSSRPTVLLPILVVLFVFSYTILTMLVFEQGQTIESQRGLIREMLKDSTQLAALKDKLAHDESLLMQQKMSAGAQSPVPNQQKDPAGASKGSSKDAKRAGKSTHSTNDVPGRPASDLEDVRRSTDMI
jgi:hypothetical protein